jgi:hypothetical protein
MTKHSINLNLEEVRPYGHKLYVCIAAQIQRLIIFCPTEAPVLRQSIKLFPNTTLNAKQSVFKTSIYL